MHRGNDVVNSEDGMNTGRTQELCERNLLNEKSEKVKEREAAHASLFLPDLIQDDHDFVKC